MQYSGLNANVYNTHHLLHKLIIKIVWSKFKLKWLEIFQYNAQIPNFMKICSAVFKLLDTYRWMDWHSRFNELYLNKKRESNLNSKELYSKNWWSLLLLLFYFCFLHIYFNIPNSGFYKYAPHSPLHVNENWWHVTKYFYESIWQEIFWHICQK